MDGEDWASVIVGPTGETTSVWYTSDYDGDRPDAYPPGWVPGDLYYPNGAIIPPSIAIASLRRDQEPNNWERVIKSLKDAGPTAAVDVELPPVALRRAPSSNQGFKQPQGYQQPMAPAIIIQPSMVPAPDSASPAYQDLLEGSESPVYMPTSPAYKPDSSAERSESPVYVPTSPAYKPDSPIGKGPTMSLRVIDPATEVQDIIEVIDTSQENSTRDLASGKPLAAVKTDKAGDVMQVVEKPSATSIVAPLLTSLPAGGDEEKEAENKVINT